MWHCFVPKVDIVEQSMVTSQRQVRKRKVRREHPIINSQVFPPSLRLFIAGFISLWHVC